jgi:hypothetical protein
MASPESSCGGCAGISAEAPHRVDNRPGLPAVDARIATYVSLRRTQLALLSSASFGKLSELRTRETDDFSIALIDAWSVVGDILTFYSERLTSEMLIATAEEPLSLRELARLVGYRPRPGVAASATLAFAMSDAPGSPTRITIDAGAKVMSTPGQDEKPVTYETTDAIEARPAWNAIRPLLTRVHPLPATANLLLFAGVATGLKPGDAVWFTADGGESVFAVVRRVRPRSADKTRDAAAEDVTEVAIERVNGEPSPVPAVVPSTAGAAVAVDPIAAEVYGQTLSDGEVARHLAERNLSEDALFAPYRAIPAPTRNVLVFRKRAAIFGHNAPKLATLPEALIGQVVTYTVDAGVVKATGVKDGPFKSKTESTWADAGSLTLLHDSATNVYLDTTYDGINAGGFVVLRDGLTWSLYQVIGVTELTKNEFTISAKCTRVALNTNGGFSSFKIRTTSVYGESDLLPLARMPIADVVSDGTFALLALDGWYPGLKAGQQVLLSGARVGGSVDAAAEARTIDAVEHVFAADGGTRVSLSLALTSEYYRRSVRINANVAEATHGESVFEVLGSGDSRIPFQTFKTRQTPQTHVTAPVPGGAQPTLEVRVNDILWTEVPYFLDHGPDEHIYVTRVDGEGFTILAFGDGVTGARLPTGVDNVRARYRKGLGLIGRVRAHQLNQPMTRPLGLTGVDNPLPAEGGGDPEGGDAIRGSVPLTVRTLDRTVSLLDYEDYARAYAGVAKALAIPLWDGVNEVVFVTVAGEGGAPIPNPGEVHGALVQSMTSAGDPYTRFDVGNFVPVFFRLGVAVKVAPDRIAADVLAAVEAALRGVFSFTRRGFAQPVFASEVLATIHTVPGVIAARITELHRAGGSGNLTRLPADPPLQLTDGSLRGAELLTIDPGPLAALTVMP